MSFLEGADVVDLHDQRVAYAALVDAAAPKLLVRNSQDLWIRFLR